MSVQKERASICLALHPGNILAKGCVSVSYHETLPAIDYGMDHDRCQILVKQEIQSGMQEHREFASQLLKPEALGQIPCPGFRAYELVYVCSRVWTELPPPLPKDTVCTETRLKLTTGRVRRRILAYLPETLRAG